MFTNADVHFDILEIARRCGVPILRQLCNGQYLARCPFCGDSRKPKRGNLYLNPKTGGYRCHRCGEGGRSVGFYARLRGVDTKTAYRELTDAMLSITSA